MQQDLTDHTADFNPYQVPISTDVVTEVGSGTRLYRRQWVVWTGNLAINLPVAVFFGTSVTKEVGRFGMVVGVLMVWLVGLALCRSHPAVVRFVNFSGILTALSQFFPMLQMYAGMIAVTVVGFLWGESNVFRNSPVNGQVMPVTAMTLLTAVIVIAVGCSVYGFLKLIAWGFLRLTREKPQPTPPSSF